MSKPKPVTTYQIQHIRSGRWQNYITHYAEQSGRDGLKRLRELSSEKYRLVKVVTTVLDGEE